MLRSRRFVSPVGALGCAAMLAIGTPPELSYGTAAPMRQEAAPATSTEAAESVLLPPEQLDALVAPIALYSDSLLAQTLVASTYPLEIIQLHQWMAKNEGLEGDALIEAVGKQPWDPSIQSMAAVPEVVKRLADDIQWTTELGNAFLAQQSDVMDAVQRMRLKAQGNGALESNEQQVVQTQVIEKETVIVIESQDPEVIYVPTYSPTVVYGPPVYPYPPIYYPTYPVGAAMVSFGIGVAWGAAWGGACCNCGWGNNDVNINIDNNFNRNNINGGRGGSWSHNPSHRGGAPYSDRATANRYGGSARGDSLSSRQGAARPSATSRSGQSPRAGAATRPSTSPSSRPSAGSAGGDRVGSRSISSSRPSSGLSGSSYSGNRARASSSRGASSMGARSRGGSRRR